MVRETGQKFLYPQWSRVTQCNLCVSFSCKSKTSDSKTKKKQNTVVISKFPKQIARETYHSARKGALHKEMTATSSWQEAQEIDVRANSDICVSLKNVLKDFRWQVQQWVGGQLTVGPSIFVSFPSGYCLYCENKSFKNWDDGFGRRKYWAKYIMHMRSNRRLDKDTEEDTKQGLSLWEESAEGVGTERPSLL